MIIDYRLRPPYQGYLGTQMYEPTWLDEVHAKVHIDTPGGPPSARQSSMKLLLEEMDAAGIGIGVTQGRHRPGTEIPNRFLHQLTVDYPGRFIALGSINVLDVEQAKEHLAEAQRYGFPGVSLDLGALGMNVDDKRVYPIYELCAAANMPVTISLSIMVALEIELIRPEALDRAARDFPGLTFVSGHGSFPYVLEIIAVAMKRKNVWISPDMYLTHFPGAGHYVEAANGYLRDRILFGTCYPFTPLQETVDRFMRLPFEPAVRDLVLFENARRLMKLPAR